MIVQGQTSGSIRSDVLKIPGTIKSINVFNQTGGAIVVNIAVLKVGSYERYVYSFNLAAKGSADSSAYLETVIPIVAGDQLVVVAGGATDYYINIE